MSVGLLCGEKKGISVNYYITEISVEQLFGSFELLRCVFNYIFQGIGPAHGFVFVNTQPMIRKNFDSFNAFIFT